MKTTIPTKTEVLSRIQQHQEQLKAFGVKHLGLFGSFVREEQDAESDVDVLVEFEAGQKTFDNFIHLSFFLEELLNRPIELVTPESLSPYIRPNIMNEVEHVFFAA
jgi:predicted nucleotidyltransferase